MSASLVVVGLVLLILALANLWFLIKTLIIMARNNIFWAIGGFFLTPIVQIIYYFTQSQHLDANDKRNFVRYFITYGLLAIAGFWLMAILPTANIQ